MKIFISITWQINEVRMYAKNINSGIQISITFLVTSKL